MSETIARKRVAELEGAELDYWVARTIGYDPTAVWNLGTHVAVGIHPGDANYAPSSDWALGGPIVERMCTQFDVHFVIRRPGDFLVTLWPLRGAGAPPRPLFQQCGPTVLVATMRAFLESQFGEEVPDTL